MIQDNMIHIKGEFPNTHFFVYNNKNFPFNFELFKITSRYFSIKEENSQGNKYIKLLDSNEEESDANKVTLDDETIKLFIKYVQRETIQLNNKNVITLNYLGDLYEINDLIESTEEYIKKNQAELVLEILYQNEGKKNSKTTLYENIISERLLDYIKDERLLDLSIPTIHRILDKYQEKSTIKSSSEKVISNESQNEIVKFLFKCLDKYGTDASVLFSFIDIKQVKSDLFNTLIHEYSNVFDFHFLNSNLLMSIYEKESQLIQNQLLYEKMQRENNEKMRDEFNEFKREQNQRLELMKNRSDEVSKEASRKIDELKSQLDISMKSQEEQKRMINELKTKNDRLEDENKAMKNEIDKMKEEFNRMKKELEKQINEVKNVKEKADKTGKQLKDETTKIKDETKKYQNKEKSDANANKNVTTIKYDYNTQNRFNGILKWLGNGIAMNSLNNNIVSITSSSTINSGEHLQPKNVLNYEDDKQVFQSKLEPNSWLCIDFREHKVSPVHYSIKSHGYNGKGSTHPQSWDIEGSNNSVNWQILDSRSDEKSLDDCAVSNTFKITNDANKNEYYRYLRIIQKGKSTSGNDSLAFSAIEFFGSIEKQ